MAVIEVENLNKSFKIPHEKRNTLFETLTGILKPVNYETFKALSDINFKVEEGEILGIIGENGSGKSTLLKILAKIINPTSGNVKVNKKVTPFLELGVGFQQDLTAAENVKTYATIMGLQKKEIEDKLDDIIEFAGLEKFRDTKLKNFSSGMQVRLAFSTAIQTDPEILLLDEVLAVGDMEFQQKCLDVLNQYKKKGVTIIFVSHDLGSIRRFCDRTLLLDKGKQVILGNTGEVIDKYIYGREDAQIITKDDKNGSDSTEQSKSQRDIHSKETNFRKKEAQVTKVEFLDKYGKIGSKFKPFDPMTIRIFYNSYQRVFDPVFGIALYSETGYHLYGTNTELKKTKIKCIEGKGTIDLKIERIPLLSGRFFLTVAIHTLDQKIYDWRDKEYYFDIISEGTDAGVFEIPCKWEKG